MILKALLAAAAISVFPAQSAISHSNVSSTKPQTDFTHDFRVNWLPNKGLAQEARIKVDPTTNSVVQAGWLGIGNSKAAFIQCGWAQGGTFGPAEEFCQEWKDGNYQTQSFGNLAVGSYVTVGLSTNSKGQWICWMKLPTGKWTVAWMGNRDLYPGKNTYYVATETQIGASLPKLVEQTRTGNGAWK